MSRTPNAKALQVYAKKGTPVLPSDTNLRCLSRATAYRLRGKGGPAGKGAK